MSCHRKQALEIFLTSTVTVALEIFLTSTVTVALETFLTSTVTVALEILTSTVTVALETFLKSTVVLLLKENSSQYGYFWHVKGSFTRCLYFFLTNTSDLTECTEL